MLYKASAPGSLMLLGEYAVLHAFPAVVCAVDKRIIVNLEPRDDQEIHVTSSLGKLQTKLSEIKLVKPFEFVLMTLKKYQPHFKQGCNITIEAEFSNKIGFASSAAVTVATLSAISAWLSLSYTLHDLLKYAREIIVAVQGMGSGADVAACVYGGMIAYEPKTLFVEKFLNAYPITVVYSGTKTPTPEAVAKVQSAFAYKPDELSSILQKIGEYAKKGIQAIAEKNRIELGRIMNRQQIQMEALGVSTQPLNKIVNVLQQDANIVGAKISGSGFGDSVVGLGRSDHDLNDIVPGSIAIPVTITNQGVFCEKS
jgi:mevalonate kinase